MKKLFVLLSAVFWLGGCAPLGLKSSCDGRELKRPSFFAQGQYLAAFKTVLEAHGNILEGILQIKKTAEGVYDATLFAAAGGYKLMQAEVTADGTEFLFLSPEADRGAVRAKAESFLTLLLFAPATYKNCRTDGRQRTVTYKDGSSVFYEYCAGENYPRALSCKKTFGAVRMTFDEYAPYEEDEIPHYLYYRDGSVEAELVLLTLKKQMLGGLL